MKNNYNPFTVPENFFEDKMSHAVAQYKRRRRQMICAIVATLTAVILVIFPTFVKENDVKQEIAGNSIAQMYEYDVFLEVNF